MGALRRLDRWAVIDAVLTAAVLATGAAEIVLGQLVGPLWATTAAVLLLAASQVVRRTHAWFAVVLAFGAVVLSAAAGVEQGNFAASVLACITVIATAGYALEVRSSVLALGFGFVCVASATERGPFDPFSTLWLVLVLGGPWAAGRALRARHLLIENLRATTAELERSREELAEHAVEAERLRIAREVHDIVSHSVTVMTVQADAAERTLAREPETALAAIRSVQDTGRLALDQLRQMLGVLRQDPDRRTGCGAELAPQPRLLEIHPLVQVFRTAGLEVEYDAPAVTTGVPDGVALAAFRLVQESLTNVVKHSTARRARVELLGGDDWMTVRVADPGPARTRGSGGVGHGIVGMRERVLSCGGEFVAAGTPDGGFAVEARLPLGATS